MCHQADETFLTPFKEKITTEWDVTNLHINKKDMDGVNDVSWDKASHEERRADQGQVLDHYWNTYNKPMWVTEVRPICVVHSSAGGVSSRLTKLSSRVSRTKAGRRAPTKARSISSLRISSRFSSRTRGCTLMPTPMASDWATYGPLSKMAS